MHQDPGRVSRGRVEDVDLDRRGIGRARSHAPRLARLAAAGRSGIGRVLLGSVAEPVFAKVTAPVMLVRPRAVATTYLEGRQRM